MSIRVPAFLAVIGIMVVLPRAEARTFVAYSMKEAARQMKTRAQPNAQLSELGGMTDLLGMVYDKEHNDCIIVGISHDGKAPSALNDLVVAMRALMVHGGHPLVSIDQTPETERTGMQVVRFEGGIENTGLGQAMLDADVHLKKLALGTLSAELWGVRSYLSLLVEETRRGRIRNRIISRFWVSNPRPSLAIRKPDGVFAIMQLNPTIETEILYAEVDGKPLKDLQGIRDEVGDLFARQMTSAIDDLASEYPVFTKIEPILAMVSLAAGMVELGAKPALDFWLEDYPVDTVETPERFEVIRTRQEMADRSQEWVLTGGIEVNPIVVKLKKGYPTAFRQVVLQSRPSPGTLVWYPPLQGWPVPQADDIETEGTEPSVASSRNPAFSIDAILHGADTGSSTTRLRLASLELPPLRAKMPEVISHERAGAGALSNRIGGVMLSGTAAVEGEVRADIDVAGGNFCLVVDGKNARIDPKVYRKFITALWCVYYSEQDPGISIDPPKEFYDEEHDEEYWKKPDTQSVRYIGRVLNTDLARVMREADYLMKKWAVGTEQPNYPGFFSVDRYQAELGVENRGVPTRRWFVPKDLSFKRGGELLLFDAGRIEVKTEYDRDGMRGKASAADEKFADLFTQHYEGIAEKNPIYQELFEYAKLVSLAKYLKQQGVPLHWFLLANKDLVLLEDSPTELDGLLKRSDCVRGLVTKGGVNLKARPSYRYDPAALAAINEALPRLPAAGGPGRGGAFGRTPTRVVPRNVSFDLGGESYTVLPQHTLTSGRDHRGIRYQTDLALRQDGRPGLELVRYFNPRNREGGEFGKGWHLLIPYRVKPADDAKREFLNVSVPQRMVVENLVTGQQELLTFNPDHEAGAGYLPDRSESSQVVGLFLISNGSYRLTDKLANQFLFDQAGYLTDMYLSPRQDYHVHIEYADRFTAAFLKCPYLVRPMDNERIPFLNVKVPKRIRVTDLLHGDSEVLTFSEKNETAGYVPEDSSASRFRLAVLLSNGGLQLADRHGNETRFDPGWKFKSMRPSREQRMVRSVSMGTRKATFGYTIDGSGAVMIASASLSEDKPGAQPTHFVRYEHDDEGRLCRVQHSKASGLQNDPGRGNDLALISAEPRLVCQDDRNPLRHLAPQNP